MSTKIGSAGITFPDSTVQATSATTTSLTAGTGISVSAATGAVTISQAAPAFNAVGSYSISYSTWGTDPIYGYTIGSTYSAAATGISGGASGTWRFMGVAGSFNTGGGCFPSSSGYVVLWVRTV